MPLRVKQMIAVTLLLALFFVGLLFWVRVQITLFEENSTITELYRTGTVTDNGVIIDTDISGGQKYKHKFATVRYTVNGQSYTFESIFENVPKFQQGKSVQVVYNPNQPNIAEVYDTNVKRWWFLELFGWTVVLDGVILFLTVAMTAAFWKNRKRPLKKKKS